jgi:REP element-mobilizing transposase RayT
MSYTNLLYHIVYATKERAPLITNILRPRLHEYLGGVVRASMELPWRLMEQRITCTCSRS